MVLKSFYLLGADYNNGHDVHSIEIDLTRDFTAAKYAVADSFSVLVPESVGFQTPQSQALADLDALLDVEDAIAVTVDGHAVREVPGPSGLPIVGNYYQVYPDHIGNNQRLFDSIGPTIQHTDMGRQIFLTSDPAVANLVMQETEFWSKEISGSHPLLPAKDNAAGLFITDTNTRTWRLAHRFLPPALAPKAVRKYIPMAHHITQSSFRVWDYFAEREEAFEVFPYMFKLTSEIVAKLILDMDLNHFESPDAPTAPLVTTLFHFLSLASKVGQKGAWYSHLPFGDPKRLRDAQAAFMKLCADQIEAVRAQGGGDLPIKTAALEADSIAAYAVRAVDEEGKRLPTDVLLGALPIIIGAGFATTSSLLSWLVHCATAYPGVQDRLLQELIDHGTDENTQWHFDEVNELHYLDNFIKEVQRLFNPAFQPARTAQRDQIIPGGLFVPKGAVMTCAIHALHRNSAVWDDSAKFDPDRWDTDKVRKRPAGAYMPFASGPRSCIGLNFALAEAKTVFVTLLYRYEFSKYGDEIVRYDHTKGLYKPENLYCQIKKRTSWPVRSLPA